MTKTLFIVSWTNNGKKITKEYPDIRDANQSYNWLKRNGGNPEAIRVRVDKNPN